MGTLPSPSLTDPDLRNSRIRFFTGEFRSRWRRGRRPWLACREAHGGDDVPAFVLASSAIRCRFVDRFAEPKVSSRVSRQRLSSRGAPLPSRGSRRARFPAVSGTMKALRLPACASPVAYLFRFRGPRDPPLFVLALAALPDGWRTHPGQGIWSAGRPFAGMLSLGRKRDLTGSQAIHPMPLPRSKTPAGPTILTLTVSSMLPPLNPQRRLQRS